MCVLGEGFQEFPAKIQQEIPQAPLTNWNKINMEYLKNYPATDTIKLLV